MPVIFENQLKAELAQNRIKHIYILFGEDSYLVKSYENAIINKTCGKDNEFDFIKLERDIDLQIVFDAVNQFPMLSERKCVVLSDYDFENASKTDFDRLIELLSDNNDFSTLVLSFDAVQFDFKHSARAKKMVSVAEKSEGSVANICYRTEAELAKMLVTGAKKRECDLDIKTANYIVENCGLDINILIRELEKLCCYAKGRKIINSDVDAVCVKSVEASVYEYVKRVISCDTCGAISILNDLIYMKFEPMVVLYTVASTFVDAHRVNAGFKSGRSIADISQDFQYKNKSFLLNKAAVNLKRLDDKKIRLCINEILEADRLLKGFSADSKTVLEQMTVKIIYIISSGDKIDKT